MLPTHVSKNSLYWEFRKCVENNNKKKNPTPAEITSVNRNEAPSGVITDGVIDAFNMVAAQLVHWLKFWPEWNSPFSIFSN